MVGHKVDTTSIDHWVPHVPVGRQRQPRQLSTQSAVPEAATTAAAVAFPLSVSRIESLPAEEYVASRKRTKVVAHTSHEERRAAAAAGHCVQLRQMCHWRIGRRAHNDLRAIGTPCDGLDVDAKERELLRRLAAARRLHHAQLLCAAAASCSTPAEGETLAIR